MSVVKGLLHGRNEKKKKEKRVDGRKIEEKRKEEKEVR